MCVARAVAGGTATATRADALFRPCIVQCMRYDVFQPRAPRSRLVVAVLAVFTGCRLLMGAAVWRVYVADVGTLQGLWST